MRFASSILLMAALLVPAFAAQPVPTPRASDPVISKQDLKLAMQAFSRGLKLKNSGRAAEALAAFEQASNLVPKNLDYLSARELTRQQLVYEHLQRGNSLLLANQQVEALAEFRSALGLDPSNDFALQRLRDSLLSAAPQLSPGVRILADAGEIELAPSATPQSFHYRGAARSLIESIARAFGISVVFDDSAPSKRVRYDVDNVTFTRAMDIAAQVTKTFWTPIANQQVMVAADTRDNRAALEHVSLRTFYVSEAASAEELSQLMTLLRTIFDLRFVSLQASSSTLTVRAPRRTLDAATRVLEALQDGRPQVMLDVRAYQVSRNALRTLGLDLPLQFNMFNITSAALALLKAPNIQDLINQLIASGGINQANPQAIAALLAQLQNQQNSIFKQPFAVFGGGITLFGVSIPPATANFSLTDSRITSLEHLTLRASQGTAASFRVGSRFPILNAIFAPIANSPAISQVIQNNSFQTPFPSFSYEDLGVILKATPQIHGDVEIGLKLELEIKALGAESFNGVPVLTNRAYSGSTTLRDGETAVVAGMITRSEENSLRGIPGLAQLPPLKNVAGNENKQKTEDEMLIVITPHIVRTARTGPGEEIMIAEP